MSAWAWVAASVGLALALYTGRNARALIRLGLCRIGLHTWAEWLPNKQDDAHRCRHCLRWRAGAPPRQ